MTGIQKVLAERKNEGRPVTEPFEERFRVCYYSKCDDYHYEYEVNQDDLVSVLKRVVGNPDYVFYYAEYNERERGYKK